MKLSQLIRSMLFVITLIAFLPGCEKQGAVGPQGGHGERGTQGARGDGGQTGEKGPKGDRGDTGATGPRGAKGPKGDRGDTGAAGPTGAKGPKGDRGEPGAQGPAGPRGAQGPPGTGQVIYSAWFTPDAVTGNGEVQIQAPELTAAILNSGEVYIYLKHRQTGEVSLLDGYHYSYYRFLYSLEVGKIHVYTTPTLAAAGEWGWGVVNAAYTVPTEGLFYGAALQDPNPILYFDYRYVLVPGGTLAQGIAYLSRADDATPGCPSPFPFIRIL